jgi:L-lactate utilization protein LutB
MTPEEYEQALTQILADSERAKGEVKMDKILVNWKTTVTGIGAVAAGIAALCTALSKGNLDFNTIVTDAGIIVAGITGLFAKDHNVTGAGDTAKAK